MHKFLAIDGAYIVRSFSENSDPQSLKIFLAVVYVFSCVSNLNAIQSYLSPTS